MVWTEKDRFGRPKKKWNKDGTPNRKYWTGAFFVNLNSNVEPTERVVYEIKPVKGCKSELRAHSQPRSIEIWKEPGTNEVRIVASADKSDKSFPHNLGHKAVLLDESLPEWTEDEDTFGWDVGLTNQFSFGTLYKNIPHILNSFVSTISQFKSSGVCLQVVWQDMTGILEPILKDAINSIDEQEKEYEHDKDIKDQYSSRLGKTMIGFSIRGMALSPDSDALFAALESVAREIEFTSDHLSAWNHHGPSMRAWLESRSVCSQAAIDILANNALKMWKEGRLGIDKELTAMLVASVEEFAKLFQIPDDPKLPLQQMRQRRGGATPMRTGFALDSTEYGKITESPASIDPLILMMHMYVLGATGSGKSSLLRTMIKHLEIANKLGTYESAIIFIDVKSRDSEDCYLQCDKDTDVTYIDVNDPGFALNFLELPKCTPENRDAVISRTVGHILDTFKEIYSQPQTYVQLERVMRLLLHYLYANDGIPTLLDLYALILELQKKTEASMDLILRVYKKTSVPEMEESIKALKSMPRDSWTTLINRVEPFIVEKHLRDKFANGLSTINFDEMIKPGKITIFRIAEAETPTHIHKMISTIIVMRIWEAVLGRDKSKISPVVLFLDEFHTMAEMNTVKTMLSRARSFGLGLVLAHQNLQQIPDNMIDTIVGNTATQLYGRISGTSAAKVARIVEPTDATALTEKLSSQPNYTFMHASIPKQGQERDPPFAINVAPPPRLIRESLPVLKALPKIDGMSIERKIMISGNNWTEHIKVHVPTKEEWLFMIAIRDKTLSMREAAMVAGLSDTNVVRSVIKSLKEKKFVVAERGGAAGNPMLCSLTSLAKEQYFSMNWYSIGHAKDIPMLANCAFEYYISKGMFVAVSKQGGRIPGVLYTDLVVYDYDTKMATSAEIESASEVHTHPEHVLFNMKKWPDMGFANCHVWSMSEKVVELRERVPNTIVHRVKCFLVDEDGKIKEETDEKTE